ncbi:hypothetical protein J7K50_05805 [bacterium]|nr:hypothetical protein [bacterium]
MKSLYGIPLFLAFILILVFAASACSDSISGRLEFNAANPPATDPPDTISAKLETSLHGTARGMQFWFDHEDGFGPLTGVNYADVGCGNCHTSSCQDCHGGEGPRSNATCTKCHSRQGLEAVKLGVNDLHFEAGMVCVDCHEAGEVHGDGNEYNSQFEASEIGKDCEDCHDEIPENTSHQMHADKLHCSACHVDTVVTCYNCHLESLLENHVKRPYKPFKDFVILANSTLDNKVHTVTYQTVSYGDYTFVAFAPFHSHSVKAKGHDCSFCHNSARIDELNETGQIRMTEWFDDAQALTHAVGMIPFVPDRFVFQYLTYDAETEAWLPITTTTTQTQYLYIEPLTDDQLTKLGFSGE